MKNREVTDDFKNNVSKGVIKYYDNKGRKPKKETHNKKDLIIITKEEHSCYAYGILPLF